MTALIVPVLLAASGILALSRRVDVFDALTQGARDGLRVVVGILPPLIALMSAISMLRASGALGALAELLSPVLGALGIPPETASLMLIRPLSGSGALAAGAEIIAAAGPDSLTGRCAAVMLGSTETTFYVVAVYFGAADAKKTRRAIPAALTADLVGFIMAAVTVRLFFK